MAGLDKLLVKWLVAVLVLLSFPVLAGQPDKKIVPVTVHIASDQDTPVASQEWLDGIIERANELYLPVGIEFRVAKKLPLASPGPVIKKVAQRHALAEHAPRDGTIHFFVVSQLADKSRPGVWISGVHWRYWGKKKKYRGRRYIIISQSAARIDTPAHELGHFFSLGHTKDPGNLMKSLPRDKDCSLSSKQIRRIKRSLRRAIRRKVVLPLAPVEAQTQEQAD